MKVLSWILLLGVAGTMFTGCAVDVGRPHAYYRTGYYYPYDNRYLTPRRDFDRRDDARIIVRPEGRDFVRDR